MTSLSRHLPSLVGSVLWLVIAASCSTETAKAGANCRRSTQCEAGLACGRGKCSKDLGPIAEESTVPDLGLGAGGMMPAAGAAAGSGGTVPAAGSGGQGGG